MRIVVCVKQVPEVAELSLDPVTRRLRRDGVPLQINPFDRRALLEATRLRGELGGSVTVVSMGPPQAADALRECLALGADRAIHLSDARFAGSDTLATARALARTIDRAGYDLVLGGRFSIDSETGQVGPEVAALLDSALLSGVRRLAIAPDAAGGWTLRAECERDDGFVEVECSLPALVTCTDRWKTRVPLVMPDDEAAQQRPLETWTLETLGGDADDYGQAGSPTWVEDVQPVELDRRRDILVVQEKDAALDAAVDAVLAEIADVRARGARAARAPSLGHARSEQVEGAVWVLAEQAADGRLRPVTGELCGAADQLASQLGVGITVFVLQPELGDRVPGARVSTDVAAELGRLGADVLLCAPSADGSTEEAQVDALVAAIGTYRPCIVLAPATGLGRDLVPRVAARLGLGLTGDAIGVELDAEGRLRQLKPAFGGQFVAPILSRTRPEIVTLRPGVLEAVRPSPDRPPARVQPLPARDPLPARLRTLAWTPELGDGVALDASPIVVCAGYGLGSQDALPAVAELAKALGGALGATRRVCDVGWLPRQLQIGISGRSVAPDLYLALGVRGSFNHMVGMQRAGRVIAVNRDRAAEIFAGADLGIVADAPAFVAALLARLRATTT